MKIDPEIVALNRKLQIKRELFRRDAIDKFPLFLNYISPLYDRQWFHTFIARKCQEVYEGKIKRLMLFVPPQHGKSEIVSRQFPAWVLGKNPKVKLVGCSYSSDLAQQFSRNIQRNIDSELYHEVFPETYLNSQNVKTDARRGYIRNVDLFETVGHGGFYKAVGVCGGLTGTPVDIAIIDDPVKDAIEAFSSTYRERVWDWYVNVLLTRLHNESRQILIMTRWHDDDLAGRILKTEPEKWDIITLPAIKENNDSLYDSREVGDALWPEKHSKERLTEISLRSPRTFAALYQQRPTVDGGNIIRSEWFNMITRDQYIKIGVQSPVVFFVDTAYTDNSDNDPTGIIATQSHGGNLFITAAKKVYMKFPELIRFLPEWTKQNGYNHSSTIRIEPKANGLSVIQTLKEITNLNITNTDTPKDSKETRLNSVSAKIETGNVYLIKDAWNGEFIDEVCGFPGKLHDEYVDLICYAIDYHLKKNYTIQKLDGVFF